MFYKFINSQLQVILVEMVKTKEAGVSGFLFMRNVSRLFSFF